MTQTPAGWYPDPYGSPQLRWWDGTQWTDATHPMEGPSGQGAPVTTGQWAQPGSAPPPGTGPQAQPGTGPEPGTGPQAQQATGPQPPQGTESQAQQGTGPQTPPGPPPGTGPYPQPGAGPYPQQGTGQFGRPGPGAPYPQPEPGRFAGPGGRTEQFNQPGSPYPGLPGSQAPWGDQQGTAQLPVPDFGPQGAPPKKRNALPWALGGGAVVILLIVALVVALNVFNRRQSPTAAETPVPSDTIEPSDPQVTPPLETTPTPDPSASDLPAELPQPKGNVISDPRTGLSYAFPGAPWTVPSWSELNGTGPADPRFPQWTSGYQTVSQKNYDGQNNNWVGTVTTCRLPQIFDYSGPNDLRKTTGEVLFAYEKAFYAPPHKRKALKDAAIDVDGKKGWMLRFQMDFGSAAKKAGWKWQKEEGVIVIVDQGSGQRPSMLYASVPDNLDTSVIDRVLDSLKAS